MKILTLLLSVFLFFFSSFSLSLPEFELKKGLFLAQSEPLFDDSDLADIEGSDVDEDLEDDFDTFEEEGANRNFDEEDFEIVEEEEDEDSEFAEDVEEEEDEDSEFAEDVEEEEGDNDKLVEGDFNNEDYEIISDKPGYEVVSDEDIEQEFTDDVIADEELEDVDLDSIADEELEDADLDSIADEELEDADLDSIADEELEDTDLDSIADEDIEQEFTDDVIADEELEDADLDSIADEGEDDGVDSIIAGESLNLITNIRYLAEKDQIIIDCSEPSSYQFKTNEETNQFIIEILQAKLADNLHWPYVLRDFKTDFGLIKADQKDSNTVRIIVQLKEGATFPKSTLTENGDQILIGYGDVIDSKIVKQGIDSDDLSNTSSILPARTLEDLYFGNIEFSGMPLSIHVIDAPVKQVLRFISEESGLNTAIDESVAGNVTLKLEDVPWDQALYTIFKLKSLGYTRDGNVVTILPLEKIEERTKKLKEIADRQKSLAPYETKVIPINYGKISEIEAKVKDFSTPASDFTKGGKIIVHPESNTFVIIDTPEVIKKIESLVQYLDKPPKQVMVEAKIVEVTESFGRNFGLNWSLEGDLPVSFNGLLEEFSNPNIEDVSFGANFNRSQSSSNEGENQDQEGVASLTLRGLPLVGDVGASLNLAETDNLVKVISSPKMVVISGKQASITRNAPILIAKTATVNQDTGSSTQQFEPLNVEISLSITPTVTTTGSVFLQVDVTRTDPGPGAGGAAGGALTLSRTAKTEILTKNGQTVVIGGIYEQVETEANDGIPFLRDIPLLNLLFGTTAKSRLNTELLVFITPNLLDSHE